MATEERERGSRPGGDDGAPDVLENLLVECLDLVQRDGAAAVEPFCQRHLQHADALRRELSLLEQLGLFDRAAHPRDELPAESIGEFRLIRRLGEGGMGVVYLAEQTALKRLVALKVLRAGPWTTPALATRFHREALTVARLRHEGIVTLYAAGEEAGVRYLAMELVPGRGLDEILLESTESGARLSLPQVIRWGRDLARALDCAHASGVVHRDVKPSNVRITPAGRAMLLDFGLARDLEEPSLTRTGEFQGSPHYASPEQVDRGSTQIGPASDLFSLGSTLYQCTTGELPFEGTTTEQLFQSILACHPEPARRRNRAIPHDLETVLAKAMEKDPARRYASAGAFADDLEAILELRPIAARRPGPHVRLAKWSRRNPAAASGAATAAAALLALVLVVLAQARAERERTREEARAAVEEARARLASFRTSRWRMMQAENRLALLQESLGYRYLAPEEDRELDRLEAEVAEEERARETIVVEILALLQRAEAASPDDARRLRAELYAEKLAEAENELNPSIAAFYRELVLALDPHGAVVPAAGAKATISFVSYPSGAEVHLFRYREDAELRADGERRLVPVPFGDREPPLRPGSTCLRVVRAAEALAPGDLVLELAGYPIDGTMLVARDAGAARAHDRLVAIDGETVSNAFDLERLGGPRPEDGAPPRRFELERAGARITLEGASLAALGLEVLTPAELAERGGIDARVDRGGLVRDEVLPAGLVVRATAAPLFVSTASRAGTTPTDAIEIESGGWLALFRLAGHEDLRYPFAADRGEAKTCAVALEPRGSTPVGFVRVVPLCTHEPVEDFWLQEREVTFADYLEFLNDPQVSREIEDSAERILVPRERLNAHCERASDGRFAVAGEVRAEWPVFGVSWFDAQRYARWRSDRARAEGLGFEFALPRFDQWKLAGNGADRRIYVFGSSFRPKWVKSNYARKEADPEPVMRFPVDESVHGAFDMAGSVLEWLDDWYFEGEHRRTAGGAWGLAAPSSFFLVQGGGGAPPKSVSNMIGFRLVARRVLEESAEPRSK